MRPIAIIVQRCHPEAVGGAESLAWQYARFLASKRPVEILTTCAIDAETWQPVLAPGSDQRDGIDIRRFKNQIGHTAYWQKLHHAYLQEYNRARSVPILRNCHQLRNSRFGWSDSMQEEWLRHQGPHSPDLYNYLYQYRLKYAAFLFVTYLFPTTYFGIQAVCDQRTLLIPALHDEPTAYLPIFKKMASCANLLLYNTYAEAALVERVWGPLPGRVVSMAIESEGSIAIHGQTNLRGSQSDQDIKENILYLGRIDAGKGCAQLCDYYLRYCKETHWQGNLYLAGRLQMRLPRTNRISYLGFLSEDEKQDCIKKASVLAMPSPYESLSIVTLEAMLNKIPILVNARASALQEHVQRSGCGFMYKDYAQFKQGLDAILSGEGISNLRAGQAYVQDNFSSAVVAQRLSDAIDFVVHAKTSVR